MSNLCLVPARVRAGLGALSMTCSSVAYDVFGRLRRVWVRWLWCSILNVDVCDGDFVNSAATHLIVVWVAEGL